MKESSFPWYHQTFAPPCVLTTSPDYKLTNVNQPLPSEGNQAGFEKILES